MNKCEEQCGGECHADCEEEASPPVTGAAGRRIRELEDLLEDARSLIDGAIHVVFLFDAGSPAQIEWRKEWVQRAITKHGASLI